IRHSDLQDMDRAEFFQSLTAVTDAELNRRTRLDVLTNGEQFYEAELDAIAGAQRTVNLEAYIFRPGQVADRFVAALAARAREGVEVRVLLDGVGSMRTTEADFEPVLVAGGKLFFYHPLRVTLLPRYNNRTHRELLVIDGTTGFVGGAGFADEWLITTPRRGRWRDTMVRVQGSAVNNLQATFFENWLEASGEMIVGDHHFPTADVEGDTPAIVVNSTPSAGGSTRARVLFQMLLASATQTIHITTPYFLPDPSLAEELKKAVERGVEVLVLVPGTHSDQLLTRRTSRLGYGRLLPHGVRIFEYRPSMLHAKVLLVDGRWSVIGTTNFDNRSFGLNDEVNLAVCDVAFARRLEEDFGADVRQAAEIDYESWKHRGLVERGLEVVGWLLERQQ
ncbi:MAG TPA: phospholipase D-like domain-containing protein, partial [Vicinamibacterales bacterium]|nr:phospholipase D-like domain-containing protein [Vicinamibacterales bacterium]